MIKHRIDMNVTEKKNLHSRSGRDGVRELNRGRSKTPREYSRKDDDSATPIGTSDSVYIIAEEFDSSSEDEHERIGEITKEKKVSESLAGNSRLTDEICTCNYGNIKLALILLSIVFTASVALNIYTAQYVEIVILETYTNII